jgi:hypothetical protein
MERVGLAVDARIRGQPVGQLVAHPMQQQVRVDRGVHVRELRDRIVGARVERRHVTRRAKRSVEQRRAGVVRLARRNREEPHVESAQVHAVEGHVDARLRVVREAVGIFELGGPERARDAHVALEGVRREVVDRGDPSLQAEAADQGVALLVGLKARVFVRIGSVGDPVDLAVNAVVARRLLRFDALDLVVAHRFHVPAAEHGRTETHGDLDVRIARGREDRRLATARRQRVHRVAVGELRLIVGRRDAVVLDDRHLLHGAGAAFRVLVTRRARRARVERSQAVGLAQGRAEQQIAVIEVRQEIGGDAVDGHVERIERDRLLLGRLGFGRGRRGASCRSEGCEAGEGAERHERAEL